MVLGGAGRQRKARAGEGSCRGGWIRQRGPAPVLWSRPLWLRLHHPPPHDAPSSPLSVFRPQPDPDLCTLIRSSAVAAWRAILRRGARVRRPRRTTLGCDAPGSRRGSGNRLHLHHGLSAAGPRDRSRRDFSPAGRKRRRPAELVGGCASCRQADIGEEAAPWSRAGARSDDDRATARCLTTAH